MFACGRAMVGSELRQNKLQKCILVELYLLTVGCLCVNSVVSMSR